MAENKMEEVAKLLGVELEEEFRIEGYDGLGKITELGLERYVRGWFMDSVMLIELIKGTAKIVKIPKPILDEKEKEYLSKYVSELIGLITSHLDVELNPMLEVEIIMVILDVYKDYN